MLQEIEPQAAAGKVLKEIVCSRLYPFALVVFEDGTFTGLGIDLPAGCSCAEEEVSLEPAFVRWLDFGNQNLVEHGICTVEELEAMRAQRDREAAQRQAQAEFNRFVYLGAKMFADGQPGQAFSERTEVMVNVGNVFRQVARALQAGVQPVDIVQALEDERDALTNGG